MFKRARAFCFAGEPFIVDADVCARIPWLYARTERWRSRQEQRGKVPTTLDPKRTLARTLGLSVEAVHLRAILNWCVTEDTGALLTTHASNEWVPSDWIALADYLGVVRLVAAICAYERQRRNADFKKRIYETWDNIKEGFADVVIPVLSGIKHFAFRVLGRLLDAVAISCLITALLMVIVLIVNITMSVNAALEVAEMDSVAAHLGPSGVIQLIEYRYRYSSHLPIQAHRGESIGATVTRIAKGIFMYKLCTHGLILVANGTTCDSYLSLHA